MSNRRATIGLLIVLVAVASGCSSGGSAMGSGGSPDPTQEVRLTVSGGCGDAFLWATTPKGDLAVTVSVEARDRSGTEPATIPINVPDPDVTVEVLRGTDLARNFCNDTLLRGSRPTDMQAATAGTGSMSLDPSKDPGGYTNCGTTSGRLRLRGLVAEDGTTFTPIDATTDQIGCYAG